MHSNNFIDLTGKKFGKLTVCHIAGKNKYGHVMWDCICECGKEHVIIEGNYLKSGHTKSCGCLVKEKMRDVGKTNKKKNHYTFTEDYVCGYTDHGIVFLFDQSDYDLVSSYKWRVDRGGYIVSFDYAIHKNIQIHRLVMAQNEYNGNNQVDHINRNKLDNRKCNLRIVTPTQNASNSLKPKTDNLYTGVHKTKQNTYIASITHCYKVYTKTFQKIDDAIAWRKQKEIELFGEYRCKEQ